MEHIDKIEQILIEALKDYSKKNKLMISKVESGSLSNQFERGNGITLTMDDGKVFEISIFESH
jgi:hypothetical protein